MFSVLLPGIAASKLKGGASGISDDAASGETLIAQEVRSMSDGTFYVDSAGMFIPWNNSLIQTGTAMLNGGDDTRFDIPTGASYVVVTSKIRVSNFDQNYVFMQLYKNGALQGAFTSKLYGQGWHPIGGTWIIPIVATDYIQIYTGSDDPTNQSVNVGRQSFVDVRVY